ncbi:MAG TPA: nucleotidyl transferase AbiEii/AbiGii toxin family protein [Gemmatimonadaceae bacterium]|nr:nucleotidyl transferase AbiEii/AbiGii toxin family protein [Gemmatimonadaceae bacterium]
MSSRSDPPAPPSVGRLEKYVLAVANAEGVAAPRVRHWVSFMMLCGALDRASVSQGGRRCVVKGGVALELRIRGRARATQDLDVVIECEEHELVTALDEALRTPYGGCTFTRRSTVLPLRPNGVRVEVQVAYRTQRWATVKLDVTPPDAAMEEERVAAISLAPFGLVGPESVPCLSLRYHIAQKFHGLTKVHDDGTEHDRYRDAIDLLLLQPLIDRSNLSEVRAACEETFRVRAERRWPPVIALPERWRGPFATDARAVALDIVDLVEAESALRAFVSEICASADGP